MVEHFLKYIEDFIEHPNPAFDGLPVCPFARAARIKHKILFISTNDFSPLHIAGIAGNWSKYAITSDVLILLLLGNISWGDLEQLCKTVQYMKECEAIEVFSGHPDSHTLISGIYTRRDPIANLQCNRKDLLVKARETLK